MTSFILSENRKNPMEAVDLQKESSRIEWDFFDLAFGEKALGRMYGVSFPYKSECGLSNVEGKTMVKKMTAFGRLYYTRLNMSSMDVTTVHCNSAYNTHEHVRPIHQVSSRHIIFNLILLTDEIFDNLFILYFPSSME